MAKQLESPIKMIHKFTVMEAIIGAIPACGNCKYHHNKRLFLHGKKLFPFCDKFKGKPKHYYRLIISNTPNTHPDEKYFLSTWRKNKRFNWPDDRIDWVCFRWEPRT